MDRGATGLSSMGLQRVRHNWVMHLGHSVSHLVIFWIWDLPSYLEHSTSHLTFSSSGCPLANRCVDAVWWTFTALLRSSGDPHCVSARPQEWPLCCVIIIHPHLFIWSWGHNCSPDTLFHLRAFPPLCLADYHSFCLNFLLTSSLPSVFKDLSQSTSVMSSTEPYPVHSLLLHSIHTECPLFWRLKTIACLPQGIKRSTRMKGQPNELVPKIYKELIQLNTKKPSTMIKK